MREDEIYEYLGQEFEWSRSKAARNLLLHGVRFPEAASVFFDDRNLTVPDLDHSEDEQRYTIIGESIRTRALLVVHVFPWRKNSNHQREKADASGKENL